MVSTKLIEMREKVKDELNHIYKGDLYQNMFRNYYFNIRMASLGKKADKKKYQDSIDRALELMDLTLQDPRWRNERLRELHRVREMITDAISGGKEYGSTLEDLDRYFFAFAFAARLEWGRVSQSVL